MPSNDFEYPNELEPIFDKLNNHNLKAIIVGGFVRDFFLGKSSKDIDIEVYGLSKIETLINLLQEFGTVNIVGKSFGVCKLTFKELDIDFSLPRIDNKIAIGHRGFEVETYKELDFKTASSRRDFTINSIGYDTKNKKILDPFNGLLDLANKRLKIVDIKSFQEDSLRILRAMQMVARFELQVQQSTLDLCTQMVQKNLLGELAQERIYEEFKKLFLKSKKPSLGFEFLKKVGGLSFFHSLNFEKNKWDKLLHSLDSYATNTIDNTNMSIYFSIVCYQMDKKSTEEFFHKITKKKSLLRKVNLLCKVAHYLNQQIKTLHYNEMRTINLEMLHKFLKAINIKEQKVKKIQYLLPLVHAKDIPDIHIQASKEIGALLQKEYELQLKKYFN